MALRLTQSPINGEMNCAGQMTGKDRTLKLPSGAMVGLAEYGDPAGRPVLALHGAPACRLMFLPAEVEARRRGLRLIAPDRPGCGLTPLDTAPTLASRTDWHLSIADALGLEKFAILAISGGGPYATALAARAGRRVTAMALVSPVGPLRDYVADMRSVAAPLKVSQRAFFLGLPERAWLLSAGGRAVAAVFKAVPRLVGVGFARALGGADRVILSRPDVTEVMLAMTAEALRNGHGGGVADLTIYSRPWSVNFEDVTAPSVLWQGTADKVVPPVAAAYLASRLPGCRFVSLEGAGHFWIFDHIPEVLGEIVAMIDLAPR